MSPSPSQYVVVPDTRPSFLPSPAFVITCACLVIDHHSRTVLLARESGPDDGDESAAVTERQARQTCRIPQGPKDIDEGLLSAAVRHTFEATGVRVDPLRTRVATRAGVGCYGVGRRGVSVRVGGGEGGGVTIIHEDRNGRGDAAGAGARAGEVTDGVDNCEPFAVCEVTEDGVRRIVLYFLAKLVAEGGSGRAAQGSDGRSRGGGSGNGEKQEAAALWTSVGEVESGAVGLSEEERMVVKTGLELMG